MSADPFQDTERETGRTNSTFQEAQAILSVFDDSAPGMRLELVELVRGFVELPTDDRLLVIRIVSRLAQR
jgi:hypothetical protein